MTDVKPALNAEEWEHVRRAEKGDYNTVITAYSMANHGGHLYANRRHALAALCLYQQPFGFTRDDLDTLFQVQFAWQRAAQASGNPSAEMLARIENIDSFRARISALLPPETP